MKRRLGILLSTISSAAVTAALGAPAPAEARPEEASAPIERLASIREAYLAMLKQGRSVETRPDGRARVVQWFPNFPNFQNFPNWRNV